MGEGQKRINYLIAKYSLLISKKSSTFPSKHKANIIISLPRSRDLLTALSCEVITSLLFFIHFPCRIGKIDCRFLSFLYYLDLMPPNSSPEQPSGPAEEDQPAPKLQSFPAYTMISHQPVVKTTWDEFGCCRGPQNSALPLLPSAFPHPAFVLCLVRIIFCPWDDAQVLVTVLCCRAPRLPHQHFPGCRTEVP